MWFPRAFPENYPERQNNTVVSSSMLCFFGHPAGLLNLGETDWVLHFRGCVYHGPIPPSSAFCIINA